jgi:hypothetical protein
MGQDAGLLAWRALGLAIRRPGVSMASSPVHDNGTIRPRCLANPSQRWYNASGQEEITMGASLKPGEIAPRCTLPSAQGPYVSLDQSLRQGRGVLLVFLRHLG